MSGKSKIFLRGFAEELVECKKLNFKKAPLGCLFWCVKKFHPDFWSGWVVSKKEFLLAPHREGAIIVRGVQVYFWKFCASSTQEIYYWKTIIF